MPSEYQKILSDMNRPRRKQEKPMKKIFTAVILMAAIAVGTFSAFKHGLIYKKDDASTVPEASAPLKTASQPRTSPLPSLPASSTSASAPNAVAAAVPPRQPEQKKLRGQPVEPSGSGTALRPPAPPTVPASTPLREFAGNSGGSPVTTEQGKDSVFIPAAVTMAQAALATASPIESPAPVPVATTSLKPTAGAQTTVKPVSDLELRPGRELPVADVARSEPAGQAEARPSSPVAPLNSVPSPSPAQAQAQMQAMARQHERATQAQSAPAAREEISAMAAPGRAAVPALSEAKARIKAIDQLLSSNPPEALRRIEELQAMPLEPEDAAEAGYRRGYVARLLRDETNAEKSWKETAEKYPSLRGGRFSALAIGDTWYHQYAGVRPQMSYWDDIQVMYSRVLGMDDAPFLPEQVKVQVKEKLNRLNDSLFFGSAPSKLARYHKVEPGELLSSIANKYRVDYESIARINGIDPNRIRAGMDLKLVVGNVEVVVRKNSAIPGKGPTLTWYLDGRWVREYPSCVGEGVKTPPGTYTFTLKERFPSWTNPVNGQLLANDHPENILGSRWMAMKGMDTQGLGIHGTTVDDSIPGYTSAGCVRLLNKDVEELFSFGRIGGKVIVLD